MTNVAAGAEPSFGCICQPARVQTTQGRGDKPGTGDDDAEIACRWQRHKDTRRRQAAGPKTKAAGR